MFATLPPDTHVGSPCTGLLIPVATALLFTQGSAPPPCPPAHARAARPPLPAFTSRAHAFCTTSQGLYDADVHGPSLPTQLPTVQAAGQDVQLAHDGWAVVPLEHHGIKLMSFGWLVKLWCNKPGAEIRAGQSPGQLAFKLLHTTVWGDLDYLVVDSPPGTGEIPTALYSKVPLAGAVVGEHGRCCRNARPGSSCGCSYLRLSSAEF